jgi:hypothetical protein
MTDNTDLIERLSRMEATIRRQGNPFLADLLKEAIVALQPASDDSQ